MRYFFHYRRGVAGAPTGRLIIVDENWVVVKEYIANNFYFHVSTSTMDTRKDLGLDRAASLDLPGFILELLVLDDPDVEIFETEYTNGRSAVIVT